MSRIPYTVHELGHALIQAPGSYPAYQKQQAVETGGTPEMEYCANQPVTFNSRFYLFWQRHQAVHSYL